jgi:hypothetical protein
VRETHEVKWLYRERTLANAASDVCAHSWLVFVS